MRTLSALLLLTVTCAGIGSAQEPPTGATYLQILAQVDSTTRSAIVVDGDAGTWWFDPAPVLTLEQISEAAVEQHGVDGGGLVVCLRLTETGREALERHQDRMEGLRVGVIIEGRLIGGPIGLPARSPQILFSPTELSVSESVELVDDLNSRIDEISRG